MAEKSSWDQANRRQKLGFVWGNRKKISQIIKDYSYLPFFLLIILWIHRKFEQIERVGVKDRVVFVPTILQGCQFIQTPIRASSLAFRFSLSGIANNEKFGIQEQRSSIKCVMNAWSICYYFLKAHKTSPLRASCFKVFSFFYPDTCTVQCTMHTYIFRPSLHTDSSLKPQ